MNYQPQQQQQPNMNYQPQNISLDSQYGAMPNKGTSEYIPITSDFKAFMH